MYTPPEPWTESTRPRTFEPVNTLPSVPLRLTKSSKYRLVADPGPEPVFESRNETAELPTSATVSCRLARELDEPSTDGALVCTAVRGRKARAIDSAWVCDTPQKIAHPTTEGAINFRSERTMQLVMKIPSPTCYAGIFCPV